MRSTLGSCDSGPTANGRCDVVTKLDASRSSSVTGGLLVCRGVWDMVTSAVVFDLVLAGGHLLEGIPSRNGAKGALHMGINDLKGVDVGGVDPAETVNVSVVVAQSLSSMRRLTLPWQHP